MELVSSVVIRASIKLGCCLLTVLILAGCIDGVQSEGRQQPLGEHEALRTYVEFADGTNRGMYDSATDSKGYQDEDYDATTAMVINWHRVPEAEARYNARLRYRQVYPSELPWEDAEGESFKFWHRDERVNRVLLRNLNPGSVYEYKVREYGTVFRFRTMPDSLDEQPVKIVMTADHQAPSWSDIAHDNTRIAALQQPDMFVVAGDFVNDEGVVSVENAERWASYLDYLYDINDGYFLYDKEIEGEVYENIVIPHVSVLGNHETGEEHHIRWPADLYTSEHSYPEYVAANWMELLFHWPYSSEGFYSEFNPDHPNMNPEHIKEGFGKGGFGKLSFSDYLLLIGLDNSQNWEGAPDNGLRDWDGNLITDTWPWFETNHADVRQDVWLKNLLEPEKGVTAGDQYTHILPIWHRGLFGTVRKNMTFKNRGLLKYWLPVLYRNGVRLIKEGHDHSFTRTVPLDVTTEQPENSYLERLYYEPNTWQLTDDLSQEYLDDFYAINTLKANDTDEIIGWEYEGYYTTYNPDGMIVIGHGGWAAGRRELGQRGGGNAGFWFVDDRKGGEAFGGSASYHMTTVHLTNDDLTVEAFHPNQITNFEEETDPEPLHRFRWDMNKNSWFAYEIGTGEWVDYNEVSSSAPEIK